MENLRVGSSGYPPRLYCNFLNQQLCKWHPQHSPISKWRRVHTRTELTRWATALRRILSFTVPSGSLFRPEGHLQRGRNFSFTIFCTETWRKNLQEQKLFEDIITGIYLGANISPDNEEKMVKKANEKRVPVKKMRLNILRLQNWLRCYRSGAMSEIWKKK